MNNLLLPCPFCGSIPVRKVSNEILSITCPNCVSIGFHNHIRFGCLADSQWNNRVNILEEKGLKNENI